MKVPNLRVLTCASLVLLGSVRALNPEPFQEGLHDFTENIQAAQEWGNAMLATRAQAAARIPPGLRVRVNFILALKQ